jgi:hypothetical protein
MSKTSHGLLLSVALPLMASAFIPSSPHLGLGHSSNKRWYFNSRSPRPLCLNANVNVDGFQGPGVKEKETPSSFRDDNIGGAAGSSSGSRWQQWYGIAGQGMKSEADDGEVSGAALLQDDAGERGEPRPDQKDTLGRLVEGTYNSLDWMVLKRALSKCARTTMGRQKLKELNPYQDILDIERAHNAIAEVRQLRDQGVVLPISRVFTCSLYMFSHGTHKCKVPTA